MRHGRSRRLDHIEVEVLDRLGLAFQEEGEWEEAGRSFEKAYALNKKLGLTQNLAANRRSIAYSQYRQSEPFWVKKKRRFYVCCRKLYRGIDLAEKYGVADKKNKAEEGLINLDLKVAVDKTGSTAAGRGFSVEQEKRLAEAFTSRIYP